MKNFKVLFPGLILVVFLLAGCMHRKVMVGHDYRFSNEFRNYATYAFLDCDNDSSYLCTDVQNAIRAQMQARGYVYKEERANLYVNFTIYYDPMSYKGYDQPGMITWLTHRDDKESKYTPVNYFLNKGTLMISLIEADTDELVWRGYAAGIFNENSSKKNYFKNIVSSIFKEYPLMAKVNRVSADNEKKRSGNY